MKKLFFYSITLLSIQSSFAQLIFSLDTIFLQNTYTTKLSLSPDNHCWSINQRDSSELYEVDNLNVIHNHTSGIQGVTHAKYSDVVAVDSGTVFIGTYGDYLVKCKNNVFTSMNTSSGLLNANINSLIWTQRLVAFPNLFYNSVIMGTSRGVYFTNDRFNIKKSSFGFSPLPNSNMGDSLSVVHYSNIGDIAWIVKYWTSYASCYPDGKFNIVNQNSAGGTFYTAFPNGNNIDINQDSINTYVNIMSTNIFGGADVYYGNQYWGTNKGLYYSGWECWYGFTHKLDNIPVYKIFELRYFPVEIYNNSPSQQSYTLIGTENGLYYKYSNLEGLYNKDSLYYIPQTSGYKIYDIDVDTCNSRVWLATDKGIVRLLLTRTDTSMTLASPQIDTTICQSNPVTLKANSSYLYQWQKDKINISMATKQAYTTTQPGSYRVIYSYHDYCRSYYDTSIAIKIKLDTTVCIPQAFPDTVKLCEGGTFGLNTQCSNSYRYQWYKNDTLISVDSSSSYTVTTGGFYQARVLNCNNYAKLSDSVFVLYTNIPKPLPIIVPGNNLCAGDSAEVSVLSGDYTIKWYNGANEISVDRNVNSLWVDSTINYRIEFSKNNCTQNSDSINIIFNSISKVKIVTDKPLPLCKGSSIKLEAVNQSNNYLWSDGEQSNYIIVNDSSVYHVKSVDINNCKSEDSIKVAVVPIPTISLGKDTVFCEGYNIPVVLQLPTGFTSYYWNGVKLSNTYQASIAGEYIATIYDHNNCHNSDTIFILNSCPEVFIPNLFTPDGDGKNDSFHINGLLPNSTLKIYDRWGGRLYENENYDNSWEGQNISDGIYYYEFISDYYKKTWKGWVQVLR
jgi:gliding motility-associated-like protein